MNKIFRMPGGKKKGGSSNVPDVSQVSKVKFS